MAPAESPCCTALIHQCLARSAEQPCAAGTHPVHPTLETRGAGKVDLRKERPAVKPDGLRYVAGLGGSLEFPHIGLERFARSNLTASAIDAIPAQGSTDRVQQLTQPVCSRLRILVGPEQRHQRVARRYPLDGQVHEQGRGQLLGAETLQLLAVANATQSTQGDEADRHAGISVGWREVTPDRVALSSAIMTRLAAHKQADPFARLIPA
jgi:hypothetical protein